MESNPQQNPEKLQHVISFLRNRFTLHVYSGLFLTVVLTLFIYILLLFVGVVEDVVTQDQIVQTDQQFAEKIAAYHSGGLTSIFRSITQLGDWPIISGAVFVILSILFFRNKWRFIIPFLFTIIGSELFNYFGKLAFHRQRPLQALIVKNDFSFPSGHATIAVALYGFLAYIIFRSTKNYPVRGVTIFLCAIIIFIIGLSRLYLGVHYLSDIWGGYLLGALWLIAGITLSEWFIKQKHGSPSKFY